MARVKYTLKDFKRDPVKHIAMPLIIEFLSQFIMTFWGVMTEEPMRTPVETVTDNSTDIVAEIVEELPKDYTQYTFGPAFQTGISVWVCITLFSKMSYAPAQFNPSFTLTLVIVGTVPVYMLIPNIIVQCIASLFGAFMSQVIRGAPPPALIIPDEASSWSILVSEVILVASVTIIAAELTQNPRMDDPLGALAIGMGVFMSILSGKYTGVVCISPSRVFGPAVLVGGAAWNRHWLLWIADLIGSASSGIFWLAVLAPFDRSLLGRFARKESSRKSDVLMDEKKEMETES